MKQIILRRAMIVGFVASGCAMDPAAAPAPETSTTTSALTTINDTDFATECSGILSYANSASVAELDSYLPSDVAANIFAFHTATRSFDFIADLSSVSGVGEARLEQIANRSKLLSITSPNCFGIAGEVAVSNDDKTAILAFVNTAPQATIRAACRENPDVTAAAVVAARPYTSLTQITNVNGVGPMTFRSFRDAAIQGPFDLLAQTVTTGGHRVTISTNFDWFTVLFQQPATPAGIQCWGIASNFVTQAGGTVRTTMANAAEVLSNLNSVLDVAGEHGPAINRTAGMADLTNNVTGQTFFGCYLNYDPGPLAFITRSFFVNTVTGYRVYTEEELSF